MVTVPEQREFDASGTDGSLRPVSRLSLLESVYESLKGMLMDHRLAPNARLSIEGLARSLAVSPTPVREALSRLEAEGLVVRRSHSGFTVSPPPTRDELADIFDFRLMVEPTCASRAAERRSDDLVSELHECRAQLRPVRGDGYSDYRTFAAADARLHTALAAASGNLLVRDLLLRLRPQLQNFRATQNSGFTAASREEHGEIVGAVCAADPAGAEHAMRVHLVRSRDRILSALPTSAGA